MLYTKDNWDEEKMLDLGNFLEKEVLNVHNSGKKDLHPPGAWHGILAPYVACMRSCKHSGVVNRISSHMFACLLQALSEGQPAVETLDVAQLAAHLFQQGASKDTTASNRAQLYDVSSRCEVLVKRLAKKKRKSSLCGGIEEPLSQRTPTLASSGRTPGATISSRGLKAAEEAPEEQRLSVPELENEAGCREEARKKKRRKQKRLVQEAEAAAHEKGMKLAAHEKGMKLAAHERENKLAAHEKEMKLAAHEKGMKLAANEKGTKLAAHEKGMKSADRRLSAGVISAAAPRVAAAFPQTGEVTPQAAGGSGKKSSRSSNKKVQWSLEKNLYHTPGAPPPLARSEHRPPLDPRAVQ
eukprot:jgi/Botrbrau1/12687/Bobra.67_1s0051.1